MSIIIMVLLLSILILVHEAGHFFTAKMFGMRVDKFGFGLPVGPTLYEKKIGETTVCVHAFLLGGYVSFPDDDEACDLPADSQERFINKPYYQKVGVVVAGVLANIVTAFVLVILTATFWGHLPSGNHELYVKQIIAPEKYSVWQSGLQEGDRFFKVNGQLMQTAYAFKSYIKLSKGYDGKTTTELIERNYDALKSLNPALVRDEIIPEGVNVRLPQVIYENVVTLDKYEARGAKYPEDNQIKISEKALKLRDYLRAENKSYFTSKAEYTMQDLAEALADNVHPLNITVLRNGKEVDLKPIYVDETAALGIELKIKEIDVETKTIGSIFKSSFNYLIDNTYMMVYGIAQVFTGNVPLQDLHGIIAITKIGGDEIDAGGIFPGLLLTALISMNLALINILPIPALDGGHLLFLTFERLSGRKLNEKIIGKIASAFFFMLIALMVYVIFNDIYALIIHKF